MKARDLTGQRFGRLTVIELAGKNKHGQRMWLCKCDCGTEKVVAEKHLKSGGTNSCGCLQREIARDVYMTKKKVNYADYGI